MNKLYGLNLDEEDLKAFFERVREPKTPILTSQDVVVGAGDLAALISEPKL